MLWVKPDGMVLIERAEFAALRRVLTYAHAGSEGLRKLLWLALWLQSMLGDEVPPVHQPEADRHVGTARRHNLLTDALGIVASRAYPRYPHFLGTHQAHVGAEL